MPKPDNATMIHMAMMGMLPLFSRNILASGAYQKVRTLFAEADAFAAEADQKIDAVQAEAKEKIDALQAEANEKIDALQAEGRRRYKAALEAAAALLSEQGLLAVVDDLKDAREELKPEA